jgi:riboflavin synthase
MFTGLIEATGTVLAVTPSLTAGGPTRLTISAPELAPRLRQGDSIAVSGVCLTALEITRTQFSADLAQETVERTHLASLVPGDVINLELPTPAGSPLGGHVVQGHVDGVGTLLSLDPITKDGKTDWRLRVAVPSGLIRYIVPQGSITLEGISLTVADLRGDIVAVAIIPHTYEATALRTLLPGAPINVEVDVLAKYAERQFSAAPPRPLETTTTGWTVTEEYLLSNGY